MKNKLSDLNNHLFAQLERLADEGLSSEQLEREAKRGAVIVAVADQIVRNASVQLAAAKLVKDSGKGDPMMFLGAIEGRPLIEAPSNRKTQQ